MCDVTFEELNKQIASVFRKDKDEIEEIFCLPDSKLYRDKDMLKLNHLDQLVVSFRGVDHKEKDSRGDRYAEPRSAGPARRQYLEDYTRGFGM